MIPHERTLVKRLEDQPFVLLGINSDPADVYRTKRVEMEVTWPSFWDGGNTSGPIASRWGVTGWPTIYVLDHTHRIRFKGPRGEAMDKAVDQLLAEQRGELPIPSTEELMKPPDEKKPADGGRDGGRASGSGAAGEPQPALRIVPAEKPGGSKKTGNGGG